VKHRNVLGAVVIAIAGTGANAGQAEALEVFAAASCGALTFQGDRMVEDIGNSFMHFTKAGRAALIAEMARVGLLSQAISKTGALRCFVIPQGIAALGRRVGENGLDEYEVKADVNLQWAHCDDGRSCANLGSPRRAGLTGTVATLTVNGRLAYKLTTIAFHESPTQ